MIYDDLFDPWYDPEDEEEQLITCQRCGEEGLHWSDMETGEYRLYDQTERLHICQPTDEGFEALE